LRRRGLSAGSAVAAALAGIAAVACAGGDGGAVRTGNPTVIVLGFDGMDYELAKQMMAEGRLPNLARLAAQGTFQPLGTSMPAQSPVAWSNFITGLDAGGHGIFDFIHRDPSTMIPYLSTSRAEPSKKKLTLGKYQIPLGADKVELLRHGQPFWEVLEKRGIHTSILRMPANFPPSGTAHRELSGMGTPDILGSYGTFSYYTSDPYTWAGKDVSGGKVYDVGFVDGIVEGTLYGPANPFLADGSKIEAKFTVYVDPDQPVAKLVVGNQERVLKVGEWSDWIPIAMKLVPTQSVHVIGRFYLKEVRPTFGLYVTPLNLDPMEPAMPISTPPSFAAELASAAGRFYTQGMPEDTKAFKEGVFTADEFATQARMAGDEVLGQYGYVLDRFQDGLLFYYFGNGDQVSHMMWRAMDPGHPAYKPSDARFADTVKRIYEQFDAVVGKTLPRVGAGAMLVVMSDHGFTSWRRAFHLNAWLKQEGYLAVRDPYLRDDPGLYANVDWSRTRAYALGLNGLYINVAGREKYGIVDAGQREALAKEIAAKLLEAVDPKTGQRAVTKVLRREEYRDRGYLDIGPDLVVGYAKGVRGSNESALGKVGQDVVTDNTEEWSGDHCMDPDTVPGVLFTSRPLRKPVARLEDLAAAVLAEFGVEGFPERR
jgi:predicted AlkP superfamily phosphohydrolase/phosphomutase